MANEGMEVILQMTLGLPWRQASEEKKKEAWAELNEIMKKWKTAGIRLIGTFQAPKVLDGYSNNMLFGISDLSQMGKINTDIMGSKLGKIMEDFRIVAGGSMAQIEQDWKSW